MTRAEAAVTATTLRTTRALMESGSDNAVPHSGNGLDRPRLAQLLAQRRDDHPRRVGERVGVLVPRTLEERLGAEHATLGPQQLLEDAELLRGQRQQHIIPVRLMRERVEPELPEAEL